MFKFFSFFVLMLSVSFAADEFVPTPVKPKGFIQSVATYHLDDGNKAFVNNFSARRVQMFLDGTLYQDFAFKIFMDYSGSNFLLLDSYLDWNVSKVLSFRVGKFKVPTNFERLQASSRSQFIEPGFSSALLPNRDVGVQFSGVLGLLEYQLAALNGVQDGNSGSDDLNDDKDLWGRVVMNFGGFGIGSSFGRGWHDNSALPNYKTPNRSTGLFSYRTATTGTNPSPGVISKGYVEHFNPQVCFYGGGGLSLNGEYVLSNQSVERVGFGSAKMSHYSWQSSIGLVLTGEEQTYKGFKVKNPVHKGGKGALEVLGRIGEIQFDEASDVWVDKKMTVESVFGWTLGMNWYLNDNIRFQLNYEDNEFNGSTKPEENVLSLSMNLSY